MKHHVRQNRLTVTEQARYKEVIDRHTPRGQEMTLQEYLAKRTYVGPFKVKPVYSKIGDMIDVYFTDEPAYAKQISDEVTLMISFASKSVVGVKISNVKKIVEG